jgi:protein phosphatase 2C family protein 2/3
MGSKEGKKRLHKYTKSHEAAERMYCAKSDTDNIANFSGCTACVSLITKNEIYVANAGDSRCVLSKKGVAVELSEDHKPENVKEKKRIEEAGGYVEDN